MIPVFIEVLVLPVFTIHWFFNVQEIYLLFHTTGIVLIQFYY